ncbi:MAG: MATE family efflux transporter [Candidatus ainarchaeum sp.]|nr:MATE family efflux transporter [Candidatus ainarchaeum sp.]MDD3976167.1 MATE family efflux transporter [Candidatus ainarchaeum sp.]
MNKEDLTKGSISKHIKNIAVPAAIGFIFQTFYNLIDTFYAGKISVDALSAMTVSMPIFFIIISLGSGIGIGMNTLVGNLLGENKKIDAQKQIAQGIILVLFLSIFLVLIGIFFTKPILDLLHLNLEVFRLTLDYVYILYIGIPFILFINLLNSILISRGDSKTFRNLVVIGVITNIILDPLFMNGFWIIPSMGLKGIAFATILINFIKFLILLLIILKDPFFRQIKLKYFIPKIKNYMIILKYSLPASFSNIILSLSSIILIYFLSFFGNEVIAAVGVSSRIEQIIITPLIGLVMALIAIVSQNNGAKNIIRIKETINKSFKYSFLIIGLFSVILFIFSKYAIIIFSKDLSVITIGVKIIRITILSVFSEIIFMISAYTLQAFKKPGFLLWGSFFKKIIFLIIGCFFVVFILDFGIYSIFWVNFIISWFFAFYSYFYMKKHLLYKEQKI